MSLHNTMKKYLYRKLTRNLIMQITPVFRRRLFIETARKANSIADAIFHSFVYENTYKKVFH